MKSHLTSESCANEWQSMKPDPTARSGAGQILMVPNLVGTQKLNRVSFMLHSFQFHFLYIRICFEEKLPFVEILAALN